MATWPYEWSEGCFSLGTGVVVEAEAADAIVDERDRAAAAPLRGAFDTAGRGHDNWAEYDHGHGRTAPPRGPDRADEDLVQPTATVSGRRCAFAHAGIDERTCLSAGAASGTEPSLLRCSKRAKGGPTPAARHDPRYTR